MKSEKNFIDYYEMFGLDRSMTESQLKKALGKLSFENSQREGCTDPNNIKERKEVLLTKKIILEAIKTLGNAARRKEYDARLDEAIRAGTVSHEKSREVQDIIERTRKYYEQRKYELALSSAQEALKNNANSDEMYEIMTRSYFMLGDYYESLDAVDKGANIFQNAIGLWWLRIRIRIMMEMYDEAQAELNEALNKFQQNPQFAAEQAYLYFHSGQFDVGKRIIDSYLSQNPSDMQYRQYVAYNLIEISNYCYKYDSQAEIACIIKQQDYEQCLQLVTWANEYYQDDYTLEVLQDIQSYGELKYDEDNKIKSIVYMGVTILAAVVGLCMLIGGAEGAYIAFIIAAIGFVLKKVIDKYSYCAIWEINRDYYRGYKENSGNWLYNIASAPFDVAMSWFQ